MLNERGIAHGRIDLACGYKPKSARYHLDRASRALVGVARILFMPRRSSYEMSIDGGLGLAYNILLAGAARLRGASMLLYHHSTSYVVNDSRLMRLLLRVSGSGSVHIACSPRMLALLCERYGMSNETLVLSNAAWIAPSPVPQLPPQPDTIMLGYIGALWPEKGVLRALETFKTLRRRRQNARIQIAGGDIAPEVQAAIEAAQTEYGSDVAYLGSISDAEKWQFFASLDYFLFPTLYPHETQSSVAPEAMSAGVPVIAHDHRFVGEMVGEKGGLLIASDSDFAALAADWIMAGADPTERLARRARARAHYETIYAEAGAQLETLIQKLVAA